VQAISVEEEFSPAWHSASAGLATLRLVDRWLDEGAAATRADRWALRSVRKAVDRLAEDDPQRLILSGIVELIATSSTVDMDLLAPRLLAYGHALDLEGRFPLAVDVLRTVVLYVHPAKHADVAADANMRLGFCLRMLGLLEEAGAAYSAAGNLARSMGDTARLLRARVADGKLALARGNLPAAASILDEVVDAAAADHELSELRATALHDRAAVAFAAGEHEAAVHYAFAALEGTIRPVARDRVLADLATMLIQLGAHDSARDALVVLSSGAQEQYTRWMAQVNLMELAVVEGAELVFESHRRALMNAPLPVELEANYHLHAGFGFHAFGRADAAATALRRALALATTHSLNQLIFQAEKALELVERSRARIVRRVPAPPPVAHIPASLAHVTNAIRELRELGDLAGAT